MNFQELTETANQRPLTEPEAHAAMSVMADGLATPAELETFLRTRALSLEEVAAPTLTGLVKAVRERAIAPPPLQSSPVLDTCGTGGGVSTFNVSTAAALLAAAARRVFYSEAAFARFAVAKHGNRAIASKSGSADVLEALGVKIELTPEATAESIDSLGFGFLFAPRFHRAFSHVMPVRKKLAEEGLRTAFNFIGPLVNPARPNRQLVGIFMPSKLRVVAETLAAIGVEAALCVSGETDSGRFADELSISGPTRAILLRGGVLEELTLTPRDFGIEFAEADELRSDGSMDSAAIVRRVIEGKAAGTPQENVVIMNTAAALFLAAPASADAPDWKGLAQRAREIAASGRAAEVLSEIASYSQNHGT